MQLDQYHASQRFGFGPRVGERLPTDTRDWLIAQLDAPDPVLQRPGPSVLKAALADRTFQQQRKAGLTPQTGLAAIFGDEITDLLNHAVLTDLPLRERLVWFWTNHFTVSERAGNWAMGLIGAYVYEAIRPNVAAKFVDLVKAVLRHPAMLFYLDNTFSVGPHSPYGLKEHRGVNENLARECLELHTLGVDAGYTQQDVTGFAEILSGRMLNREGDMPGFVFRADWHEPGPKTFMGHVYPAGFEGSEQAVEWVANHPATRRHIATKMVRHFISDEPPAACVEQVVAVLEETGGDLRQAMIAIIDMSQSWKPFSKFRTPAEYVIAVQRALGLPPQPGRALPAACAQLGQRFMGPLLPNGWPDVATNWISGEALLKRADYAMTQASRPGVPDAQIVLNATIGGQCSAATRVAVAAAPNNVEAVATILASPEFMRR